MSIKIPIALSKLTNKLVNVKEATHGKKCDCYCHCCKADLIAVNKEKIQKAHFRHDKESNCIFNNYYESYIHWLAKEIFKEMDKVLLPPICVYNLREGSPSYNQFMTEIKTFFKENNLTSEIINESLLYSIILQLQSEIKITNVKTEVAYNSKFGDITVDVIVAIGKHQLFIEPYFSNKIDDVKFKKIVNLNVSTISINLFDFVRIHQHLFTIQEFKTFLINNIGNKCWEYIRTEKIQELSKLFFSKLDKVIKEYKPIIAKNIEIKKAIAEKLKIRTELIREVYNIDGEIHMLEKAKTSFPFEKLNEL